MSAGERLIAAAKSYEGAPYRHLGRSRLGTDCLGLLVCAAKDAGLLAPERDWLNYTPHAADYTIVEEMEESGLFDRLPAWQDARPGDIILQKFHARYPASHILIVTKFDGSYWWALHSPRKSKRVIEQRIGHAERCFAAYRFKEVTE